MYSEEVLEDHNYKLTLLLQKNHVPGNVIYKNSQNPEQRGFWHVSRSSRGFLGSTVEESQEAVLTIIECVKAIEKPRPEKISFQQRIKNLFF